MSLIVAQNLVKVYEIGEVKVKAVNLGA